MHSAVFVLSVVAMLTFGPARLAHSAPPSPSTAAPTLADLASGQLKIIDLTWPLNEQNAYWPGPGYTPFELKTIATLEEDGVLSKAISMPEHLGTHIDAPNHFEKDQTDVSQIPPEQLFAPGVVIDVSLKDFAVHHIVGEAGRYGLENVAHLDQLPPRDFWLIIAPIKIETGTGGPTRIFAILPKSLSIQS